MSEYDPKRARTKKPLPMWVDAFVRDTLELEADEIGAYHLILYAMWTRVSCDFPDDDRKLARVARVSTRLWKSRVGPVLRPFFQVEDGMLISKRLRKEATYTERQGKQQSDRKNGVNSDKVLENNNMVPTGDISTEEPTDEPTQLPNYPINKDDDEEEGAGANSAEFRERILSTIGADPISGLIGPNGKRLGTSMDMMVAQKWRNDLGLTEAECIAVVSDIAKKMNAPPGSFNYFTGPMKDFAGQKNQPKLQPTERCHERNRQSNGSSQRRENRPDLALEQIARLAGLGAAPGDGRD